MGVALMLMDGMVGVGGREDFAGSREVGNQ